MWSPGRYGRLRAISWSDGSTSVASSPREVPALHLGTSLTRSLSITLPYFPLHSTGFYHFPADFRQGVPVRTSRNVLRTLTEFRTFFGVAADCCHSERHRRYALLMIDQMTGNIE